MIVEPLLQQIKQCTICASQLPMGTNPVVAAGKESKIVIIGQAPGRIVHQTGIPWNDKSGDNLRNWLGVGKDTFYDITKFALIPMGFCFPGKGKSGDLPPRPECAPQWHQQLLGQMHDPKLILLVGQYAQHYYLKEKIRDNLTETVQHFNTYLPDYFPLPHPSPRNNIWQAKNKWFGEIVLPELKQRVNDILTGR